MRTHLCRVNFHSDKHRVKYKVQFTRYRCVLWTYYSLRCTLYFVLCKYFEINQKIIRFCLDFPLKMRIFALLSEGSPVWHEHCSNTTQTLHRHDTNISALLQYFCIDFAAFALRLNPNESTNSHKFSQKYFLLLTLEISFCLTY